MTAWERAWCWLSDRRQLVRDLDRALRAEAHWRAVADVVTSCTGPPKHIWLAHQAEQAEARAEQAEERCASAVEQAARATRDLAEQRRVLFGKTS